MTSNNSHFSIDQQIENARLIAKTCEQRGDLNSADWWRKEVKKLKSERTRDLAHQYRIDQLKLHIQSLLT